MRAAFALLTSLLCSLLAGCGKPSLFLGRPGEADARSMILLLPAGSALDAIAVDLLRAGPWLDRELSTEAPFDLVALLYLEELGDLDLVPGVIESVTLQTCGAQALAKAHVALGAHVDRSELDAADWRTLDVLPPDVAAFRRPGPCPCRDVEILADIELPNLAARAASRIDGRRALVPLGDGVSPYEYYDVGLDGVFPLSLLGAPTFPHASAYFDDDNIWIGDVGGLYHGGRTRPFTLVADVSVVGPVEAIAGPQADDFFFVSRTANLYRFHDGAPDVIVSSPARGSGQEGVVTQLGPERWIAAVSGTYQLVRVLRGVHEDMITVPPDTRGATAIASDVDGRLYVGTSLGTMLRLEGNDLLAIDMGEESTTVSVIVPFEDGVLVATDRGGLSQISTRYGYCPFLLGLEDIRFVSSVELDDGHLLLGSSTRGSGRARALLIR